MTETPVPALVARIRQIKAQNLDVRLVIAALMSAQVAVPSGDSLSGGRGALTPLVVSGPDETERAALVYSELSRVEPGVRAEGREVVVMSGRNLILGLTPGLGIILDRGARGDTVEITAPTLDQVSAHASMTPVSPERFLYAGGWNRQVREPLNGEAWLTEDEARERYATGTEAFSVVDGGASDHQVARFVIEIGSGPRPPRMTIHLFDATGSARLAADLRPEGERLFCDRITAWTYPEHDAYLRLFQADAITTSTFEPDGSGTLRIKDKAVPGGDTLMQARDVPIDGNWLDVPDFGDWQPLLQLPTMSGPSRDLGR